MKDIGEKNRIIGVVIIVIICAAVAYAIVPEIGTVIINYFN